MLLATGSRTQGPILLMHREQKCSEVKSGDNISISTMVRSFPCYEHRQAPPCLLRDRRRWGIFYLGITEKPARFAIPTRIKAGNKVLGVLCLFCFLLSFRYLQELHPHPMGFLLQPGACIALQS